MFKAIKTKKSNLIYNICLIPNFIHLFALLTVSSKVFVYKNSFYLRISTSCISRLVSSLFWHLQVKILILVRSLYRGDVLKTVGNIVIFWKKSEEAFRWRPLKWPLTIVKDENTILVSRVSILRSEESCTLILGYLI